MQHTGLQEDQDPAPRNSWSRGNIVLIAFLAIAGSYLIAEHRMHLLGYLPVLLLLACPLLHWFMHGGHGGHGNERQNRPSSAPPKNEQDENPPPPATGRHQH